MIYVNHMICNFSEVKYLKMTGPIFYIFLSCFQIVSNHVQTRTINSLFKLVGRLIWSPIESKEVDKRD